MTEKEAWIETAEAFAHASVIERKRLSEYSGLFLCDAHTRFGLCYFITKYRLLPFFQNMRDKLHMEMHKRRNQGHELPYIAPVFMDPSWRKTHDLQRARLARKFAQQCE